jgi:hypothetical protein
MWKRGNDMPEYRLSREADHAKPEQAASKPEHDRQGIQEGDPRGPRPLTPFQVMQLQRTMGNAGVQRLLQRRLWNNVPAKFQTANNLGAANSQYQVTSTGYRRYAPVNIQRGLLDQVYYDKPDRSFAYLTGMPVVEDMDIPEYDALYEGEVQSVVGGVVTFSSVTYPDSPPVVADIGPSEGAVVFDAQVDDGGQVTDPHVGHTVTALGQPLSTLDDPAAVQEVQKKYRH